MKHNTHSTLVYNSNFWQKLQCLFHLLRFKMFHNHNQDDDYGFLLINFKAIAQILTDKLEVLRDLAFDSSASYLFGFSFGARLIAKAATDFGPKQIGTIHCKWENVYREKCVYIYVC